MTRGPNGGPVGIPGSTSNQPPATGGAAAPAAPATPPAAANGAQPAAANAAANTANAANNNNNSTVTSQSTSQTKNYEVDRTLSHTRQPVGRLRRLSVAVLVDNVSKVDDKGKTTTIPLTADELAKVETLVKQAIGFDQARGDAVTVQNAPFKAEVVAPIAEEPFWKRAAFRDYVRQGLGAVVVLILIFAVLRPLLRSLMTPRKYVPSVNEEDVDLQRDALAQQAGQLALANNGAAVPALPAGPQPYEQRLTAARGVVTQDPKRVAQVVKTWVNEGE
jgi:flagellar M-ring protein FliF